MVTLKEVAKKANVSTATVSYILNGSDHQVGKETKEKVLKIIKELNYKPNKIAKNVDFIGCFMIFSFLGYYPYMTYLYHSQLAAASLDE